MLCFVTVFDCRPRCDKLSSMFLQGAYFAWKATAMGKNHTNGKTFLEKRFACKADCTYNEAPLGPSNSSTTKYGRLSSCKRADIEIFVEIFVVARFLVATRRILHLTVLAQWCDCLFDPVLVTAFFLIYVQIQ